MDATVEHEPGPPDKAALRVHLYGPQNPLNAERVPRKPAGLRLRSPPGRIRRRLDLALGHRPPRSVVTIR